MLIDTHLHVIDKSVLNYPWLAEVEALNKDFSYESYEREARQGGIEATLHMEVDVEPSQIEEETENGREAGRSRQQSDRWRNLVCASRR